MNSMQKKISYLQRRIKKIGTEIEEAGGVYDLNSDPNLDLAKDLIGLIAEDLETALLHGLLLGRVWENSMKVHISVDNGLEEIQAATRSLADLIGDYIGIESAPERKEVSGLNVVNGIPTNYPKIGKHLQNRITQLEKRLRG